MFDATAKLYLIDSASYDTDGNEIRHFTSREVFVKSRSVYHSEYYEAAQNGLHPTINLTIANREDYSGEQIIEFDGKFYNVIRVDWTASRDKVDLVLEERDGTEEPIIVPGENDGN